MVRVDLGIQEKGKRMVKKITLVLMLLVIATGGGYYVYLKQIDQQKKISKKEISTIQYVALLVRT